MFSESQERVKVSPVSTSESLELIETLREGGGGAPASLKINSASSFCWTVLCALVSAVRLEILNTPEKLSTIANVATMKMPLMRAVMRELGFVWVVFMIGLDLDEMNN
jgi:hypothetical protein